MHIEIDQQRLAQEIETLATFSDVEPPAVTRIVFTEQDLYARSWFKERCVAAGLAVREDAVGNTFARWEGFASGAACGCYGVTYRCYSSLRKI